jgi:monoamine oxidase
MLTGRGLRPEAAELDRRTLASWIAGLDASPLCRRAMQTMMAADNGVVAEWQSYLANLAMVKGGGLEKYWEETEVYRCKGGNQQLALKLADAVGRARVLTRTPVRTVATRRETCPRDAVGDGQVLEADHVILTAPPSVWNKIAFDPTLPPGLAPQMASNVKCLIGLRGPFWRRAGLAPDLLSDGPVNLTWHGTDGQPGPGGARRVFRGPVRRRVPRLGRAADGPLSRGARAGVPRHPAELRARAIHGLAG